MLVKGQQSGQDYRMCVNYAPLNNITRDPNHPLTDCLAILIELMEALIFSGLDIKAGYHNIPI